MKKLSFRNIFVMLLKTQQVLWFDMASGHYTQGHYAQGHYAQGHYAQSGHYIVLEPFDMSCKTHVPINCLPMFYNSLVKSVINYDFWLYVTV